MVSLHHAVPGTANGGKNTHDHLEPGREVGIGQFLFGSFNWPMLHLDTLGIDRSQCEPRLCACVCVCVVCVCVTVQYVYSW